MGLLDDAIREHLELKRLRGAAPTEVAREELEVFGSAHEELAQTPGAGHEDPEHGSAETGPQQSAPATTSSGDLDLSRVGQETAELDMRSVLEPEAAAVESLEWEVPGDEGAGATEEAAGVGETAEQEGSEPAEDVLEETPDFLRETPEQDRLWFEQQPPRDFDFDK